MFRHIIDLSLWKGLGEGLLSWSMSTSLLSSTSSTLLLSRYIPDPAILYLRHVGVTVQQCRRGGAGREYEYD